MPPVGRFAWGIDPRGVGAEVGLELGPPVGKPVGRLLPAPDPEHDGGDEGNAHGRGNQGKNDHRLLGSLDTAWSMEVDYPFRPELTAGFAHPSLPAPDFHNAAAYKSGREH